MTVRCCTRWWATALQLQKYGNHSLAGKARAPAGEVRERAEYFSDPGTSGENATALGAVAAGQTGQTGQSGQTGQTGQTGQNGQSGAMGAAGNSVAMGAAGAVGNASRKVSVPERRYEVQTDEALVQVRC